MTMFICPVCDAGFDDLDSEDWDSVQCIREVKMCRECYDSEFDEDEDSSADEGDAFSIY